MQRGDIGNQSAPRAIVVFEHLVGHPPPGARPGERRGLFSRRMTWHEYVLAHEIDDLAIAQVHRLFDSRYMNFELATLYPQEAEHPLQRLADREDWPFRRVRATTYEKLAHPDVARIYHNLHVAPLTRLGVGVQIDDPRVISEWR